MVDKSRGNSLFQETNYFEYCSESRNWEYTSLMLSKPDIS